MTREDPFAQTVIPLFHQLYYGAGELTWRNTYWLGFQAQKCPLDLWIYQEILYDVHPTVVIEAGTLGGGTALFLACMMDLIGQGRVITIDVRPQSDLPQHPRLTYVAGSSIDPAVVGAVTEQLVEDDTVLVILDSGHDRSHVLTELRTYADFVSIGSYLIVEDTNLNGNPVLPNFGPGPREAVEEFLAERNDYVADREREKFLMTFNPGGYLRRGAAIQTTCWIERGRI
jgi:cephalosporin hydroxylase